MITLYPLVLIVLLVLVFYGIILKNFVFSKYMRLIVAFAGIITFSAVSPLLNTELQILLSIAVAVFLAFYLLNSVEFKKCTMRNAHLLLPLIFFLVFSLILIAKYLAFNNGMFDFGRVYQAISNSCNGDFMQMSWESQAETVNRMSLHQEFIYLLFVPLLKVFPSGITLLLIQTFIVSLSAVYIFKISEYILNDKKTALLVEIAFLMYTPLHFTLLHDIRGDTVAILFIALSIYFMIRKRYVLLFVFAVLAFLCKEYIAYIYMALAVLLVLRREFVPAAVIFLLAAVYNFVFIEYIHSIFPTWTSNIITGRHFNDELLGYLSNIVSVYKWKNIAMLFLFLAFIPLRSWKWLIPTIPIFAGILLSTMHKEASIKTHHFASTIPIIFTAFIYGISSIQRSKIVFPNFIKLNSKHVFIFIMALNFLSGPSPFMYRFWHPSEYYYFGNEDTFHISNNDKEVNRNLKRFQSPDLNLTTSYNLAGPLANRRKLNIFHWEDRSRLLNSDYILIYDDDLSEKLSKSRLEALRDNLEYVKQSPHFKDESIPPLIIYKKVGK
ncbi:DUF2079 domain-containing protein [bacterium]|nr:DUF2079 domain-containing protein [bacterium]